MAKGYWVGMVDVTNPDEYAGYLDAARPAYEKYGAKFLVRGGKCEDPEGAGRARQVVVEFDSYETALACYNSPQYQAARKIRRDNSVGGVVIVEGFE